MCRMLMAVGDFEMSALLDGLCLAEYAPGNLSQRSNKFVSPLRAEPWHCSSTSTNQLRTASPKFQTA